MADDGEPGGHSEAKKYRKRRKSMYKTIVDQMNFYLGDANVSKSTFLGELLKKSPWFDLSVFLKFNKLVGMLREFFGHADNTDDLWSAMKKINSEVFEIREDPDSGERQVKRRRPLPTNTENADVRTIYVERLPPNVTIENLRHVFGKYGEVTYVALPKFKHGGASKGFAFVEFADEEGAKKSIEAFVAAKRKIVCLDPGELQSIKSFQIEQTQESTKKIPEPPKKKPKIEADDAHKETAETEKKEEDNGKNDVSEETTTDEKSKRCSA